MYYVDEPENFVPKTDSIFLQNKLLQIYIKKPKLKYLTL